MTASRDPRTRRGQAAGQRSSGQRGKATATHGLVEEDEKSGLGGEFHGDSEALALLDVESHTDLTDESLGVGLHLEQGDDLLDVGELVGVGRRSGLTKACREDERLADGGGDEMSVLLLACGGEASGSARRDEPKERRAAYSSRSGAGKRWEGAFR